MITKKTTLLVFLVALAAFPVSAETIKCAECGMMSDLESKFTSRIMDRDKMLYFCDIGDLLVY